MNLLVVVAGVNILVVVVAVVYFLVLAFEKDLLGIEFGSMGGKAKVEGGANVAGYFASWRSSTILLPGLAFGLDVPEVISGKMKPFKGLDSGPMPG